MKLFDRIIRAIECNSRNNERRKLVEELEDIYVTREYNDYRAKWIISRLNTIDAANLSAYLDRDKPVESVSEAIKKEDQRPRLVQIVEDDATPTHHWHGYNPISAGYAGFVVSKQRTVDCDGVDGLVGQWKAPA